MDQFEFSPKVKRLLIILMGIGALALVYGIVGPGSSADRLWSNILINGFFFFGISMAAIFFLAMQYAAEAAWGVTMKRVFEAVGSIVPFGSAVLILVFLVGSFHGHHIYHWMDSELSNPESEHYDPIIAGKTAYLNIPFFWIRAIVFLAGYCGFMYIMRKRSLQEDSEGGDKWFFKNQRVSAGFLVFFGFTSTVAAWDWIMSIDTHWFSTLFGWYVFSGMWISGIVLLTLLIIWLKSKGYLPQINESHIHDMGKWMFAISFLWTYLWFSQFMLIWYADIPEEVTYYVARINDYAPLFFTMVLVNFALPMLLLMDRDAKRRVGLLVIVGVVIFLFHWLDVFFMVTPAVLKDQASIGVLEIGMFLGFLGLFLFFVLKALSKAPLIVKNHSYLEESKHFHQ